MSVTGSSTPFDAALTADAAVALGSLATVLAEGGTLSEGLDALVHGLALRSAAVSSPGGDIIGLGGDALRSLSSPVLELGIPGLGGSLTVTGARPSHLPALRSAAAIVGLHRPVAASDPLLFEDAEADRDEVADALHDGPVQALVVARLYADAAVRGGDVVAARDAVQDALVALRRQLWAERPRGAQGLVSALEQLSAQRIAAGRPALTLVLDPAAVVEGAAGTLAYRIAQAASASDGTVRIAVRREGPTVAVDIDGAPLLAPERWARRARALGGDLSASAGRLRLVLPLDPTARTAP